MDMPSPTGDLRIQGAEPSLASCDVEGGLARLGTDRNFLDDEPDLRRSRR